MPRNGELLSTTEQWLPHDHRIFAPTSCGGLGLRSLHDILPIAFFAGWSAAYQINKTRFPGLAVGFQADGPEGKAHQSIYKGLPEEIREDPEIAGRFEKLQHYLSACWWIDRTLIYVDNLCTLAWTDWEALDRLSADTRTDAFTKRLWLDITHFCALRAGGANAWMSATPSDSFLTLSNEQFQSLLALRLGLPTRRNETAHVQIVRSQAKPPLFIDPESRAIATLARASKGHESNQLIFQLKNLATAAKCAALREPGELSIRDARGTNRRPDLVITMEGQVILIDAVVTVPTTMTQEWLKREERTLPDGRTYQTWRPRPRVNILNNRAAIHYAIRKKNHTWGDIARQHEYQFVAAAAETTGRLSEPLARLIKRLLDKLHASNDDGNAPPSAKSAQATIWGCRISMAIQKGQVARQEANHKKMLEALHRNRERPVIGEGANNEDGDDGMGEDNDDPEAADH
jgi:hypothetical protein